MEPVQLAPSKVAFIRGVCIFAASHGIDIYYDELRRLARLSDEQLGAYLGASRQGLAPGEPDHCAMVVSAKGTPGLAWGDLNTWTSERARAVAFYSARRGLDNAAFEERFGALPTFPGKGKAVDFAPGLSHHTMAFLRKLQHPQLVCLPYPKLPKSGFPGMLLRFVALREQENAIDFEHVPTDSRNVPTGYWPGGCSKPLALALDQVESSHGDGRGRSILNVSRLGWETIARSIPGPRPADFAEALA